MNGILVPGREDALPVLAVARNKVFSPSVHRQQEEAARPDDPAQLVEPGELSRLVEVCEDRDGVDEIELLDDQGRLQVPTSRWTPPLHGLPMLPSALRRLGWRDLLSHGRLTWQGVRANERTVRALDDLDALGWLRSRGVSERAIDWFWRSALLALLNVPLEQCSAAAAMRVFRLMLGRSGYHFGFPTTGLSGLYVPQCAAAIRAAP